MCIRDRQYAGPLTEEKIKDIYERFGFISYDPDSGEFKGNYCSRFVTERFTNYLQTGGNLEEIEFYQGEDWERNAAPLLSGRVDFGYVYGLSLIHI